MATKERDALGLVLVIRALYRADLRRETRCRTGKQKSGATGTIPGTTVVVEGGGAFRSVGVEKSRT